MTTSARQIVRSLVEFAISSGPSEPHDPDQGPSHRGVYHDILTQHGYKKLHSADHFSGYERVDSGPIGSDDDMYHIVRLEHPNNSKLVGSWEYTSPTGRGKEGRSASYLKSHLSKVHKD
jgi:hypothetical protein